MIRTTDLASISKKRKENDMGIFIKNEEMPESCYECAYSVEKDGICSITEGGCDWGHSRPPHCPLEEVDDIAFGLYKAYMDGIDTKEPKEIVRCGECKHLKADGTCDMFADDNIRPSASDFCSYGERRKEKR